MSLGPVRVADIATRGSHALHAADRIWVETNCYVDLWIELLNAYGDDPHAALPFTVEQDFEGDQFTFFKYPAEDLDRLYGLKVQELAIFDSLEAHTAEQLRRNRVVLIEVDGYYLPDTRGTSYRTVHTKTTIGAVELDIDAGRLGYFHNTGFHTVEGEDFAHLFRRVPELRDNPDVLFPYVEFVKRGTGKPEGRALVDASLGLLGEHLRHRPAANPVTSYRAAFPEHVALLAERPLEYFHLYAFNTLRQLGANFELLGSYAGWLAAHGCPVPEVQAACVSIAETAKALQFQLARAVNRRKFGDYSATLEQLETAYETAIGGLVARFG